MAATLYSAMVTEVAPDVSECPGFVIEAALRTMAIEFCQRSLCWRYEHPAQTAAAGIGDYEFQVPADSVVAKLMSIWHNGVLLTPKSHDDLAGMYSDWLTEEGTPCYVTQFNEREFRPVPIPDVTLGNAFSLIVALKPTRTSTGIDTTIYEEHLDTLACGAKARLMEVPGKPWTNVMLSQYHRGKFEAGVLSAMNRVATGYGRASLRVKPRSFL